MIITKEVEVLVTPEKSLSDKKDYSLIKLQNGLKAFLVKSSSDQNDQSHKDNSAAVSLCIDVGSFEDPAEVQGLFHFLEHMVL